MSADPAVTGQVSRTSRLLLSIAAGCAVVAGLLALVVFREVRPTRLAARDVFSGHA